MIKSIGNDPGETIRDASLIAEVQKYSTCLSLMQNVR
jgi:hypothetical protein